MKLKRTTPKKPRVDRPAATEPAPSREVLLIRALGEAMQTYGLAEVSYSTEALDLVLKRPGADAPTMTYAPQVAHAAPAPQAVPTAVVPERTEATPTGGSPNGQYMSVSSPFVGTFYRSPSPESPVFVEVGDKIRKGQVMCIIEAMKLMNEIEAEMDGTVIACLVENAQVVEYGQPLFKITPS